MPAAAAVSIPRCRRDSALWGDHDRKTHDSEFGHFFHYNTVEEVAVTFGANEAMLQTGQVFVTQTAARSQLVSARLGQPRGVHPHDDHPASVGGGRPIRGDPVRCRKCSEQLHRHDYNATPKGIEGYNPSQWGGSVDDDVSMFPTIWGSDKAAVDYSDESVRTCPKCGHVNVEHPHHKWGWHRYVDQVRTAGSAKRALRSAAAAANESKEA